MLVGALTLVACGAGLSGTSEHGEKEINGRPTLVVSVTDGEKAEFAFKVAGIPFVIANDRLHTILEGDLVVRDELWDGFSIYGELPNIEPYADGRSAIFSLPSTQRNQLAIFVQRLCRPSVSEELCNSPAQQLRLKFDSESYVRPSGDVVVPAVQGLTPLFYQRGPSGDAPQPVPLNDIYDVGQTSSENRNSYIACGRPERFPVPHCTHRFVWRDALWVELTYKRSNIDDWQQIHEKALLLLDDLSRPSGKKSTSKMTYFPEEYYNG
jgi:hypothetical protein